MLKINLSYIGWGRLLTENQILNQTKFRVKFAKFFVHDVTVFSVNLICQILTLITKYKITK